MLWRHRFTEHVPNQNYNPDRDMCGALSLRTVTMWWDPATRFMLAELTQTTGGCMCPTVHTMELHRIPAAALAS